jgi:hypothetical protein
VGSPVFVGALSLGAHFRRVTPSGGVPLQAFQPDGLDSRGLNQMRSYEILRDLDKLLSAVQFASAAAAPRRRAFYKLEKKRVPERKHRVLIIFG